MNKYTKYLIIFSNLAKFDKLHYQIAMNMYRYEDYNPRINSLLDKTNEILRFDNIYKLSELEKFRQNTQKNKELLDNILEDNSTMCINCQVSTTRFNFCNDCTNFEMVKLLLNKRSYKRYENIVTEYEYDISILLDENQKNR